MADALMKYETIDTAQIDSIMEGKEPGPPQDWGDDESGSSGTTSSGGEDDTEVKKEDEDDPGLDPAKLH